MIEAILARVAEIDQLMSEQKALRQQLMDHIWCLKNPSQEKTVSPLKMLKKINAMAEFNRWCSIEVTVAEPGFVEIQMPWRPEVGQYSGCVHAGLIGTLIDTACGFAAGAVRGQNCWLPTFRSTACAPLWVKNSLPERAWSNPAKHRCSPAVICLRWMQKAKSWWRTLRLC